MSKTTSLHTLLKLAHDEVDDTEHALAVTQQSLRNARQQLDTLLDYRHDYTDRLQKSSQDGISASNYHNFRQFIATLDEAITQQNRVTEQLSIKLGKQHEVWQQKKLRLSSFEALQVRQQQRQGQLEQRIEQRLNDEMSARQSQRPERDRLF